MSKSHCPAIRAILRSEADGLTLQDIAEMLTINIRVARHALQRMPDAYIDRWVRTDAGPYAAVWCVVVPPPNCPKPGGKA